jgi:mannosyltransferase
MLATAGTIRGHHATLAATVLVVVVGALLRFHNLGGESIWLDEAQSWRQAHDSLVDLFVRTAHDTYPPLHNLALFAVIKLIGDSEWSLRLPSAIFGVADIIALYWLGTMTFGRAAGLIGAILLAFSPFHLKYSQEARMYSLLSLSATLYAATCFHYLRAPSFWRAVWVSLAGLALVYSHPYGTLNWIAIAVAFAAFFPATPAPPKTMLVWGASNVIVAAGFMPWALILARHAQSIAAHGFWIQPPTAEFVSSELTTLLGGGVFAGVILIGVGLGIVGRPRRDVAVLCVWIVGPVAIGIVASILSTPIFLSRYEIGSLPPLLLLSAFGWTKYVKDWRKASLLTALIAVLSFVQLLRQNPYASAKEDWRGVASFLEKREQAADCTLVVPKYLVVPLNYYRRNATCQFGASTIADLPAEIPATFLFLVFSPWHVKAPNMISEPELFGELQRRGWRELDRADFRDVQVVIFSH